MLHTRTDIHTYIYKYAVTYEKYITCKNPTRTWNVAMKSNYICCETKSVAYIKYLSKYHYENLVARKSARRTDRRRAAWRAFPPFCLADVFIGSTDALLEDTLEIPDRMHRTWIPDHCICLCFCLMLLIFLRQNIISAS